MLVAMPGAAAHIVVELGDDCFMTLIVQNHGTEKIRLKKGVQLGTLVPVNILTAGGGDSVGEMGTGGAAVAVNQEGNKRGNGSAAAEGANEEATSAQGSCKLDHRGAELFSQIDMDWSHLTEAEKQQRKSSLALYSDVFALNTSELGTTQLVTHSIDTGTHPPIRKPVRQTPFTLRQKVDQLIQEMLDQEVIERSESPWASPIVLVQKKDSGVQFCVDYHKLNQVTMLDEFPLPRIDDTLNRLSGARYFSTLDLADVMT